MVFLLLFFVIPSFYLSAQSQLRAGGRDDSEVARQYVQWIKQAIDEDRWTEAAAAVVRAGDFANVLSDVPYLNAVIYNHFGESRIIVLDNLNKAIDTNRWVIYNENQALLFRAEILLAMRDYRGVLSSVSQIGEHAAGNAQMRADAAMLRLLALRGMAVSNDVIYDPIQTMAQFRSQVLLNMDRFPRDPRPLRIFFEYARSRKPQSFEFPAIVADMDDRGQLTDGDFTLLELVLRRLPFLLETDPELAWMAAPFISDIEAARRLVASYRSGSLSQSHSGTFKPNPASIPIALNLGLIDDKTAVEELFPVIADDEKLVHNIENIMNTYKLLRSEEGRELFTRKLLSYTGTIYTDIDNDGYIDSQVFYISGVVQAFEYDRDQSNVFDLLILFTSDGVPDYTRVYITGQKLFAHVNYERYPSVEQVILGNPLAGNPDTFKFGPADFQYSPVSFIEIGGSNNFKGLLYPILEHQFFDLTYRSLIYFCSSLTRRSLEFEGAIETIYMNRGELLQAVEVINGKQISVTEFEMGLPVIQYVDLDLDGRMETIRRFRFPPAGYVWQDIFDYRRLIASSESDWTGDGRHKTMEVYLPDGSVVYYIDIDGTGEMILYNGRER
ncbi:MAG: hypothetical protein FWD13_03235 [Treponema sp.]|nr:hypothetical protein [Treponema sp.]